MGVVGMTVGGSGLKGPPLLSHPFGEAVVEVTNERGYELADVPAFARRAGSTEAEFRRHFPSKADAVLHVLEATIASFRAGVGAAYEAGGAWPDSLRAAAYETVRRLLAYPERTRFAMVATLNAGDMARARREELFLWGAALVDQGRRLAVDPGAVPSRAGIVAVGAVAEELRRRQEGSLRGDLIGALPRVMYAAVRPYLGEAAARDELALPVPADLERLRGR
jgi:AcrR family transcriptional regulator